MHLPSPAATPRFGPADLQPGDVLLMMGEGPLSDLIAWASGSRYSHAAIVVDGGDLVEASASGVRRYSLATRLADQANYHWIDALRWHDGGGTALATADAACVLARATALLGIAYPIDQLALFGAIMAVRGRWPVHPLARWLVRIALDRALPDHSDRMVCSEVVYRAYAECAAVPTGRLAPAIVPGPRGSAPFPDVDWEALWQEIGPALRNPPRTGLRAAVPAADAGIGFDGVPPDLEAVGMIDDAELEAARVAVLGQGAALRVAGGPLQAVAAGPVLPRPNPRLVSPQDLAASPSLGMLGRLMQRATG
jgi:hypothetical protein